MSEPLAWECGSCMDRTTVRENTPEERCEGCGADDWRCTGKPKWPKDQSVRIAELETALRLILPMAKGYAYAHRVGDNPGKVLHAEAVLNNEGV